MFDFIVIRGGIQLHFIWQSETCYNRPYPIFVVVNQLQEKKDISDLNSFSFTERKMRLQPPRT